LSVKDFAGSVGFVMTQLVDNMGTPSGDAMTQPENMMTQAGS
jgi:hypothetical protein